MEANEQGMPATARQQLAPRVQSSMARAYLGPQLIEAGLLSALADWLKPLPQVTERGERSISSCL